MAKLYLLKIYWLDESHVDETFIYNTPEEARQAGERYALDKPARMTVEEVNVVTDWRRSN